MFFSPDNLLFLIILVLFARACFADLKYGIYITIFLMPTYLWRMEIFSIPTTLLELMIYILFLIWLAGKILTTPSSSLPRRGFIQFHNSKLVIGIILLFLGLTISTIISTDIKTSAGIFKGWFVGPFLFFLVLISIVKTKKQIIDLFSVWMLSGLAVAAISIFYLMAGNLTYDDRLKAFFLSPNHLAMYLAPAFLIALVFLLNGKKLDIKKVSGIKYQVLSIIFLIIIIVPLSFTHSYGAFLGIAAAIICLIIPLLGGGWGWVKSAMEKPTPSPSREGNCSLLKISPTLFDKGRITKIILCSLILSSLLFLSADKFQQVVNPDNRSSFHSRLMIWSASKEILKDNYIFGIGPGTFQEVYLSYSDKFGEPYLEWAVPQPHNIFLAFWLQAGVIGLAGFILILVWFFRVIKIPLTPFDKGGRTTPNPSLLRRGKTNPPFTKKETSKRGIHNSQFTIPIILMIYFLIHGLIDTTYWKNDLSLMFWILIGVMVICRNAQKLSIRE